MRLLNGQDFGQDHGGTLRTGLGTGPVTDPGGNILPPYERTDTYENITRRILRNATVINMILDTTFPVFVDFVQKSVCQRVGQVSQTTRITDVIRDNRLTSCDNSFRARN